MDTAPNPLELLLLTLLYYKLVTYAVSGSFMWERTAQMFSASLVGGAIKPYLLWISREELLYPAINSEKGIEYKNPVFFRGWVIVGVLIPSIRSSLIFSWLKWRGWRMMSQSPPQPIKGTLVFIHSRLWMYEQLSSWLNLVRGSTCCPATTHAIYCI